MLGIGVIFYFEVSKSITVFICQIMRVLKLWEEFNVKIIDEMSNFDVLNIIDGNR